jgi:hypothetical protein
VSLTDPTNFGGLSWSRGRANLWKADDDRSGVGRRVACAAGIYFMRSKAISPAINDPSTAISCIDQLSRILIRWAGRTPPRTYLHGPPHVLRVVVPWIDFEGLLDRAFE